MENLFIIGNGFDLAHGLPTSYGDFKKFLYSKYNLSKQSFDEVEMLYDFEFPESIMDGSGAEFFEFDKYASVYFKICNHLNEENIIFQPDGICNHYDEDDQTSQPWQYFEMNLAKITQIKVDGMDIHDKEGDRNGSHITHLREVTSDQFNSAYHDMTQHFFEKWIGQVLETPAYVRLSDGDYDSLKQLILDRKSDSYFLTFNYTPVLEEVYGVSKDNIKYIHGKIDEDGLVVGHGEELTDSDYTDNPADFDFSKAKESSRKPVDDLIKTNAEFFDQLASVKNIYIIGSSLLEGNQIDLPYLKKVLSKVHDNLTVYLDSYEMTLKKKEQREDCLKFLSKKVKRVEVIDSSHNRVVTDLPD